MSVIKQNVLANLIGSAWMALLSVGFIPLYIHFMGIESYGQAVDFARHGSAGAKLGAYPREHLLGYRRTDSNFSDAASSVDHNPLV